MGTVKPKPWKWVVRHTWKSFVSLPNWTHRIHTIAPKQQGELKLHCWSLWEILRSLASGGWLLGVLFSFTKHHTTVGMPKACYTSPVDLSCTVTVPCSWKWNVFIGVSCSQLESWDTVSYFKKSCLHVYLMLIFSTFSSRASLVFGCVEMMWLTRNEACACGLSQRDGRSEGVTYKWLKGKKVSWL